MSGPLLVAQETAMARVQTLSPAAAASLMKNSVVVRKEVLQGITLVAPLLETNKYLVASMPQRTITQLTAYISTLSASERGRFVSGWLSQNSVALITQHAEAGSASSFRFKPVPVPKSRAPAVAALTPKPAHIPRRTIDIGLEPAASRPALMAVPASFRPKLKSGNGARSTPYVITVPVPSDSRAGSLLESTAKYVSMKLDMRVVHVALRLDFTAAKGSARVEGRKLAAAVAAIMHPKLQRIANRGESGKAHIPLHHVELTMIKRLKEASSPDVKSYLRW